MRPAASAGPLAVAVRHDRQRLGRRQDVGVAGAGVIGMAVGDDGAVDHPRRIDEEAARLAPQPARDRDEPVGRAGHGSRSGRASAACWTGGASRRRSPFVACRYDVGMAPWPQGKTPRPPCCRLPSRTGSRARGWQPRRPSDRRAGGGRGRQLLPRHRADRRRQDPGRVPAQPDRPGRRPGRPRPPHALRLAAEGADRRRQAQPGGPGRGDGPEAAPGSAHRRHALVTGASASAATRPDILLTTPESLALLLSYPDAAAHLRQPALRRRRRTACAWPAPSGATSWRSASRAWPRWRPATAASGSRPRSPMPDKLEGYLGAAGQGERASTAAAG